VLVFLTCCFYSKQLVHHLFWNQELLKVLAWCNSIWVHFWHFVIASCYQEYLFVTLTVWTQPINLSRYDVYNHQIAGFLLTSMSHLFQSSLLRGIVAHNTWFKVSLPPLVSTSSQSSMFWWFLRSNELEDVRHYFLLCLNKSLKPL